MSNFLEAQDERPPFFSSTRQGRISLFVFVERRYSLLFPPFLTLVLKLLFAYPLWVQEKSILSDLTKDMPIFFLFFSCGESLVYGSHFFFCTRCPIHSRFLSLPGLSGPFFWGTGGGTAFINAVPMG